MTLAELKVAVDNTVENVLEDGREPKDVVVSLQIDSTGPKSVWAKESIELVYDNDLSASGCVLVGYPLEED